MVAIKQETLPLPISPAFTAGVWEVLGDLECFSEAFWSYHMSLSEAPTKIWPVGTLGILRSNPSLPRVLSSTKEKATYKRRNFTRRKMLMEIILPEN